MKILRKLEDHPRLLIGLIVIVMSVIRFLLMAIPTWVDMKLIYPLAVIRILCGDFFVNILLFAITAGLVMLVPDYKYYTRWPRFLIRPLLAVLTVLLVSGVAVAGKDAVEDAVWDHRVKSYTREVSQFLDEADEIVLYNCYSHNLSPYAKDARLQCTCGHYHDTILIDHDTMRIAFLLQDGIDHFFVYELKPGTLTEESSHVQLNTLLPGSHTRLVTYNTNGSHRTCAIELILPDGTAYSTTETPDQYWDDCVLNLGKSSQDALLRPGEPHPELP